MARLTCAPPPFPPLSARQHIREYLRAMDSNQNDKVEYEDFKLFMARMMCGEQGARELEMAFEVRLPRALAPRPPPCLSGVAPRGRCWTSTATARSRPKCCGT